jgi:hypothetical protein
MTNETTQRANRPIDPRRIEVVDDAIADILRSKTIAERVEMVMAANRTVRLRIEGHLRTRHPDWSDREIQDEIARRMLGGTSYSTAIYRRGV